VDARQATALKLTPACHGVSAINNIFKKICEEINFMKIEIDDVID
jgi:hypothetical protein